MLRYLNCVLVPGEQETQALAKADAAASRGVSRTGGADDRVQGADCIAVCSPTPFAAPAMPPASQTGHATEGGASRRVTYP